MCPDPLLLKSVPVLALQRQHTVVQHAGTPSSIPSVPIFLVHGRRLILTSLGLYPAVRVTFPPRLNCLELIKFTVMSSSIVPRQVNPRSFIKARS